MRLRYYMHDGSAAFRFELAGQLCEKGARELEQAWRTASSTIGSRSLIVDLRAVTGIDPAGRELLDRWQADGAQLVATNTTIVVSRDAICRGSNNPLHRVMFCSRQSGTVGS